MLALVRLCLLLVCLKGSAAEAELTPPHDLFMLTLNTNYTLTWDWDQSAAGSDSATFTVQYTRNHQLQKRNPKWTTVCAETSGRSCDLTRSRLYYLGCYTVRVQTNLNGSHSAWKSLQFCPNKDALIGPPSVSLLPIGQTLEVSIKDPEFKIFSLRDVYSRVRYNITYWKEGQEEQARTHSDVQQDWVVLDNLDPSTKYCVQVRINLTNRSRIESSSVLCERTGDTDNSPVVAAVITCVIIAVAVTALAIVKWKSISHFLWPKVSLPLHFEKSLLATPESSVCLITQPTEEIAPVSIVTVEESSHEGTKESYYGKQLNGTVENNCLHPAC